MQIKIAPKSGKTRFYILSSNYVGFKYQEFGPMFKAEFFNATQWAHIVERSGQTLNL